MKPDRTVFNQLESETRQSFQQEGFVCHQSETSGTTTQQRVFRFSASREQRCEDAVCCAEVCPWKPIFQTNAVSEDKKTNVSCCERSPSHAAAVRFHLDVDADGRCLGDETRTL